MLINTTCRLATRSLKMGPGVAVLLRIFAASQPAANGHSSLSCNKTFYKSMVFWNMITGRIRNKFQQ